MITGFNTDVQHDGVTYHVQTEDKGLKTPLILSLVYVGGTIIASKRTPYADLISRGFDEGVLTERLQRQHKLICAAIKAGRVEDLKRMSGQGGGSAQPELEEAGGAPEVRKAARKKKAEAPAAEATAEASSASTASTDTPSVQAPPRAERAAPPPAQTTEAPPAETVTRPTPAEKVTPPPPRVVPPPFVEPVRQTVEPTPVRAAFEEPAPRKEPPAPKPETAEPDIVILTSLADEIGSLDFYRFEPPKAKQSPPPSAPPPPPATQEPARSALTQAPDEPVPVEPIIDAEVYEEAEDASDEIYLSLLDDEGEFRAGQLVTIKIYVGRGSYGQRPVGGAQLTVKVLGTSFRPLIVTAVTDPHGVGIVRALLPRFSSGRAAIIIRAVAGESSAEMRRIIHQ